jgi:DnaK suppressor protein
MKRIKATKKIKLNDDYIPSEEEEYMNSKQLEYFSRQLQKQKEAICQKSQSIVNNLGKLELNSSDMHQNANALINSIFDIRCGSRYRKLLDKIDLALDRIKKGKYGYCIKTGKKIGLARLKARPVATMAIEAQEKREDYEKQHID